MSDRETISADLAEAKRLAGLACESLERARSLGAIVGGVNLSPINIARQHFQQGAALINQGEAKGKS